MCVSKKVTNQDLDRNSKKKRTKINDKNDGVLETSAFPSLKQTDD